MNTRFWGPPGWKFLNSIAFNYPETINLRSRKDRELKRRYRELFENFQHTLPCKYCRESYARFLRELPIDEYLDGGRRTFTYWWYQMHEKVNEKLRAQEAKALEERYADIDAKSTASGSQRNRLRAKARREIRITKPTPSYEAWCASMERHRAKCAKKRGEVTLIMLPPNPSP